MEPSPIDARIEASIARLVAAGPYGLALGTTAPDFTLPDARGQVVSLAARRADGPVVISFYRGDWCPFCNMELRALQGRLADIVALGASVLAISPQAPDRAAALADSAGLGFDVLSDLDQSVSAAYGLLTVVDPMTRDLHEHVLGNDLSRQNADGTWRLPIPGTYIVDGDGTVRAAFVTADHRLRMDPAEIVAVLERITADR